VAFDPASDGQDFTSTGTMNLDPGETSPASEPLQWMRLNNSSFNATSNDPALGDITWELDNTRPVTTSIVQSNQPGELFPATVQLEFNVRATVAGAVYLSRTPIRIRNTNIVSWPPGDTQLELVDDDGDGNPEPVEFTSETNPDVTAFTVRRLRSQVRD
jgi:hypothetical protein